MILSFYRDDLGGLVETRIKDEVAKGDEGQFADVDLDTDHDTLQVHREIPGLQYDSCANP